jgi:hypothetical protein
MSGEYALARLKCRINCNSCGCHLSGALNTLWIAGGDPTIVRRIISFMEVQPIADRCVVVVGRRGALRPGEGSERSLPTDHAIIAQRSSAAEKPRPFSGLFLL